MQIEFFWNVQGEFSIDLAISSTWSFKGEPKINYKRRVCCYLKKVQNINSAEKCSLHQWLQGLFFALHPCNLVPVDGTEIAWSVVDITRYFPFLIDLSPARSREGTSEVQQAFDYFEATSQLLFRQRDLFKLFLYERRLRNRYLINKGNLMS